MARELKEINFDKINFETEVINNLFQQIENKMIIKSFLKNQKEEVVHFKGGLPQVPLIVGLVGKVPDHINNLISKFVGFQSKVAKRINEAVIRYKHAFRHMPEWINDREGVLKEVVREFKNKKRNSFIDHVQCLEEKIKRHKRIAEKREAFLKLRDWEQRYLIKRSWYWLFPRYAMNLKFLNEQMLRLGFKTSIEHWEHVGPPKWYDEDSN